MFNFKCSFFGVLFAQVLDESKLQEVDSLWKEFETPEKANKMWAFGHIDSKSSICFWMLYTHIPLLSPSRVKLKHFEKFQDTTEALAGMDPD